MKKIIVLCAIVAIVGLSGCAVNKSNDESLKMSAATVAQKIKFWKTYTNPAWRYELRFPTDWKFMDTGEDGVAAAFYPEARGAEAMQNKEKYYGSLVVISTSNWQEKYNLDEFYRHQNENLLLGGYEQEEVELAGVKGIWFKGVRGKNLSDPDKLIDLVALDVESRIIEIEIHEKNYWNEIRTILNSLVFYPDKAFSDVVVK